MKLYKERDIKSELALVIGKIPDSNYIMEQAVDGREVINMCTALDNLRKQGVEEGKIQGEIQGKIEEKIEIAKLSINRGLPIDLIADITGLTIEEIRNL